MLQKPVFFPVRFVRWMALLAAFVILQFGVCDSASAATATVTTVATSSLSVANNQPILFTANVTANGKPVTSGQVQFCDATAKLCFGPGLLGEAQLTVSGTAKTRILLAGGSRSVKAIYNGTIAYSASSSTPAAVTVANPAPSLTLSASGSTGNYAFASSVTGTGLQPLTGKVSLLNTTAGGTVLSTAAVSTSTLSQTFQPAGQVGTGNTPTYLAAGDFDGDGRIDFVVSNLYGNSVTVDFNLNTYAPFTYEFPGTVSPEGLAVGDFNNDGLLDFAVAENNNSAVQIFLNQGNGAFVAGASVPAGFGPNVLAVGDFNRDGQLDIAVVNQENSTVTILLGQGGGNFAAMSQTATVGYFTTAITEGDFNGDGIPDLAVSNYFDNTATVLLGNGDGTFRSSTLNTGSYPSAIVTGDLNNDGKLDLVVANQYSQTLSVFLGDGTGNFTLQNAAPVIGQGAQSLAVADFNEDGKLDVAVTNANSNIIEIFPGSGNGAFSTPLIIPAGSGNVDPNGILASDLNGDGSPDLVVANAGTNSVQIFANYIRVTAAADFAGINVPGIPSEAVVASYSGDTYRGTGTSGTVTVTGTPLATTTAISAGSATIGVGETVQITGTLTPATYGTLPANGTVTLLDGTTTVATGQYSDGAVVFNKSYSTPGTHSFSLVSAASPGFLASKSSAVTVSVVADLVSTTTLTASATSVSRGSIVTLTATVTNGGKPVYAGAVNFCNAAAANCEDSNLFGSVQLNTTGVAVLKLALSIGSHSIKAIYQGTGQVLGSSSATQAVSVTGQYAPSIVATASGTLGNYTISVNENMGSWQPVATFSQAVPLNLIDMSNQNLQLQQNIGYPNLFPFAFSTPISAGSSPAASVAGDFNGDGKMDVVFASGTSGPLIVQMGNGNGIFTAVASAITLSDISALVAGDFNGDGKLDLAAIDSMHNLVTIALGNGNGTFTSKGTYATGICPTAIAKGDFNNDGVLDLAIVNSKSNNLTILLGKGDGTFSADPAPPAGLSSPAAIAAADFNNDGHLDLAVSNTAAGSVSVLYGNGDGTFASTTISLGAGSQPGQLVALDMDQDGKPDLAVATQGDLTMTLLLNQGNESFAKASSTAISNYPVVSLATADVNGDGFPDLVFTDTGANVNIGYNQGGKYFNSSSMFFGEATLSSLLLADFDSDGGPDMIVAEPNTGAAGVGLDRTFFNTTFSGVSIPGTGAHQILLSSPALGVFTSANSNVLTLQAQPVATTVILQPPSTSTVTAGQVINLTARVLSADNFAPTGTVSIYNGSTLLKTSTLTNNTAVVSVTLSAAGTYSFTATYNGDPNLLAASSVATPIYVVPATATSKTTLSLSAASVASQSPVTLTATTLTATNTPVTAGTINFCDASATICDNTALLGTAQLTANGTASVHLTPAAGTHQIKAVFAGTQTLLGSTSAVSTLTVTGLVSTVTQLTASGSGGNYSLIAKVTGQSTLPLNGEVTFYDATNSFGTANLGSANSSVTFGQSLLTNAGQLPAGVVAGDFNGDGKTDLAVLDFASEVTIYLANNQGTFVLKTMVPVNFGGEAIVAGDFNGDGKLDLAVANPSNGLNILLGNGDGTFKTPSVSGNAPLSTLAVADLNHDGKLDLVGTVGNSQATPGLCVFLGNGDGTFRFTFVPAPNSSNPIGLAVADFNSDGNPDVAVTNSYGSLLLFFGDGGGSFTLNTTNYLPSQGAFGIVSADFNGDGKADLAIANYYNSSVTVLLGSGTGTFSVDSVTSTAPGSYLLALGDFNLDGKMDLVAAGSGSSVVNILLNDGTGTFASNTIALPSGYSPSGIAVGDWRFDGRPGLYLPNEYGQDGLVLSNTSTTSASATLTGVVVSGTANQNFTAIYDGNASYYGGLSAVLTLAP